MLIGGEAGIGKTTLAEAGLVPWIEALGGFAAGDVRERLPAPLDDGAAATSQGAIFAVVREALADLAAPRPLVILLDALHWADPARLDLLRTLEVTSSRHHATGRRVPCATSHHPHHRTTR